jgi:hypothetical protein
MRPQFQPKSDVLDAFNAVLPALQLPAIIKVDHLIALCVQ